jgi:phosphohistidine phosphatase
MKKIYFIRHAKANGFSEGVSDFERTLREKGLEDIQTIGSYLALQNVSFDLLLSSCALRAQQTALTLAERLSFDGVQYFLEELYFAPHEEVLNIIMAQDDAYDSICVVGHNPQLNELVNRLSQECIAKIPTTGVVALNFSINSWSELEYIKGSLNFFIYPKQFHYYMPKQIQTRLPR